MDSHEAFLQAAGGDYRRVELLTSGRAADATALEAAIVELARKSVETPRALCPAELESLRACVGDAALDYVYVLMSFHFINRIADLLHVSPEAIPETFRRFEPVRKLGVRVAAKVIGRSMDLQNRAYGSSFTEQLEALAKVLPARYRERAGECFRPLAERPKVIEAIRMALEDRNRFLSANPAAAEKVRRVVQESLPATAEDARGIHKRPDDPEEAFAFVGTRYAQRTTRKIVDALRSSGYDDAGILDLAVAVADGNQWERCWRLTGLEPALYWGE